jgi:hypothetical protein
MLFISKGRIAADDPAEDFFKRRDLPDLEDYLGRRSAN